MKNAAIRGLRTLAQTFLGVFLAGIAAAPITGLESLANLELLSMAAASGIVGLLSFAQNALEEWQSVDYDRG